MFSADASTLLRRGEDTPTAPDARSRPDAPRWGAEAEEGASVVCDEDGAWLCEACWENCGWENENDDVDADPDDEDDDCESCESGR